MKILMSKITLKGNLTKNSLGHLARQISFYKENINKGLDLGIEELTMKLYDIVIRNCRENNITLHHQYIYAEYDKKSNIGRVWTDDIVIIFNEFGTGINGIQDAWANFFDYKVNLSGKGLKGWYFRNDEHNYEGITHGIMSKHMFINALKEIQKDIPNNIEVSILRTAGRMY